MKKKTNLISNPMIFIVNDMVKCLNFVSFICMSSAKVEVTKKVRYLHVKVSHFFSLFTTGKIDHLYKEVFLAAILFPVV